MRGIEKEKKKRINLYCAEREETEVCVFLDRAIDKDVRSTV